MASSSKPRPTQAGSTRKLIDIALNYATYRGRFRAQKVRNAYVSGSGVYKFIVSGQNVEDVDVIVEDKSRFIQYVRANHNVTHPSYFTGSRGTIDITIMKFPTDEEILFQHKMDVMSFSDKGMYISEYGLSPVNNLVLTKDGVKHVLETEVARFVLIKNFSTDDLNLDVERKWAIDNLLAKQYCEFNDMRPKDKEYFKDWKILSEQECAKHGIFKKYEGISKPRKQETKGFLRSGMY